MNDQIKQPYPERIHALRTLALKLNVSGTAEVLDQQKLYQGSYGFVKFQVYAPVTQNTGGMMCTAYSVTEYLERTYMAIFSFSIPRTTYMYISHSYPRNIGISFISGTAARNSAEFISTVFTATEYTIFPSLSFSRANLSTALEIDSETTDISRSHAVTMYDISP